MHMLACNQHVNNMNQLSAAGAYRPEVQCLSISRILKIGTIKSLAGTHVSGVHSDKTLSRASLAAQEPRGAGPDWSDISPWPRSSVFSSFEKLLVSAESIPRQPACTACRPLCTYPPF